MNTYAKTAKKLFIAMPSSRLPTKFQLNIFIFEAKVSPKTLLQPLKQNDNKSARLQNNPNKGCNSFPRDPVRHFKIFNQQK